MILKGLWTLTGAHTVEEYNPDPFIDALNKYGLPITESYEPVMVE